jgi:hypothetical protein
MEIQYDLANKFMCSAIKIESVLEVHDKESASFEVRRAVIFKIISVERLNKGISIDKV